MALKGLMARGERTNEAPAREASPAAKPPPRTIAPSTSVDASSQLEGRLRCEQTLRIDGCIKGEIECGKTVLIGQGARVLANIDAEEVHISGVVEGDIAARRKITLERTAVVIGDLATPGIVIEEGAKLQGRILIGSELEPVKDAEPARQAKKSPSPKKAPVAGPKRDEDPASQPLAASA